LRAKGHDQAVIDETLAFIVLAASAVTYRHVRKRGAWAAGLRPSPRHSGPRSRRLAVSWSGGVHMRIPFAVFFAAGALVLLSISASAQSPLSRLPSTKKLFTQSKPEPRLKNPFSSLPLVQPTAPTACSVLTLIPVDPKFDSAIRRAAPKHLTPTIRAITPPPPCESPITVAPVKP
jgi:hypothetical protein